MASFNNVTMLGFVGNDVLLHSGPKSSFLNLSICLTKAFKGKTGEWETKNTWVKTLMFGELAVKTSERIKKGDLVVVQGELATNSFETKNGDKKHEMYVLAHKVFAVNPKKKETHESSFGEQSYGGNDEPF